jgi:hypothetical protein
MSATDLTLAELQALPVGSIVEDGDGDRYRRGDPQPSAPALVWAGTGRAEGSAWNASGIHDFRPVKIVSTP